MFYVHFVWEKMKGKRLVAIIGLIISATAAALVWVNPMILSIVVDDAIKGGRPLTDCTYIRAQNFSCALIIHIRFRIILLRLHLRTVRRIP